MSENVNVKNVRKCQCKKCQKMSMLNNVLKNVNVNNVKKCECK